MSDRGASMTREGERYAPAPRDLDFLAIEPPAPGMARPIADGVQWLRIPLPMELNHINLWLLEEPDGWCLVDTGMAEEVCREAWRRLEEQVLGGRPLRRIFVTHDHPDHMGLAPWLAARHGADVWMSAVAHRSAGDYLAMDPADVAARTDGFMRAHGVEIGRDGSSRRGDHREWFGGLPALAASPVDGGFLEAGRGRWRVVETGGHCRGHLCLADVERRLLISGDQVLPSISPNVSVFPSAPDANPLKDFLASLERLGQFHPETLVLPSHGRPFRGLHRRLAALESHHREQLATLIASCSEPRSAFELLPAMFRRVPRGFHRLLAVGEAVAHLNHLCALGHMERIEGAGAVLRFVVTNPA